MLAQKKQKCATDIAEFASDVAHFAFFIAAKEQELNTY